MATAATLAELRDRAPVIGIQVEYGLADRTTERELLPMAEAFGRGAALYAPLAGGLLTGKYRLSREGRLSRWGAGGVASGSHRPGLHRSDPCYRRAYHRAAG
ncbi:aldo/keto reductase [Streptomyces sp. GbtcB7]|uniref:aldo/keto reductase n=1 Tax=Streptomyces sp. GbtcB7 TaxID=2824752 RepID=UPI0027E4F227|nr:aldo/keto reductase [Streptomyces sp. GbtcB7]